MKKRAITFLFSLTYFIAFNQAKSEFKLVSINKTESIVEKPLPPLLFASDMQFKDANQNDRIDANEVCTIEFKIFNKGKGTARNVTASLSNLTPSIKGLNFNSILNIGAIAPNTSKTYSIQISSTIELTTGNANFEIQFNDAMALSPDPIAMYIQTKSFDNPIIEVVDHSFLSNNATINLGDPLQLKILLQNRGQGIGENIKLTFSYPFPLVLANGEEQFTVGTLLPGESKEYIFDFIATKKYTSPTLPISIQLSEKYGRYGQNKSVSIGINAKTSGRPETLPPRDLPVTPRKEIPDVSLTSDVDKDIPFNTITNLNKFALIIGNEHYSDKVLNSQIKDVMFANVDATVFKAYCEKTLGLPTENIQFILDADLVKMNREITLLSEKIKRKNGQAEIIFYYSGHGSPDEKSKSPFLVPVGLEVSEISQGINVSSLYKTLSQSNAKRTTVFLDACFTGISETAKFITPTYPAIPNEGKIVVFAATGVSQAAEPYTEKKHGMFTYFLLKKLKETKGNISYQELDEYLKSEVGITSLNVNRKAQDPQTEFSKDLNENWKNWKIFE